MPSSEQAVQLCLNKPLNKQSSRRWFRETLWRPYDVMVTDCIWTSETRVEISQNLEPARLFLFDNNATGKLTDFQSDWNTVTLFVPNCFEKRRICVCIQYHSLKPVSCHDANSVVTALWYKGLSLLNETFKWWCLMARHMHRNIHFCFDSSISQLC